MKLLMISGDSTIGMYNKGMFYQMLKGFSKYWDRIDIICPKIGDSEEKTIHDHIHIWPVKPTHIIIMRRIYNKALEIWKKSKFDVMIVHDGPPFYHGIAGYLLSKKLKVPYVLEFFHIVGHPKAANLKEKVEKFLYRLYAGWASKNCSFVRSMHKGEVPDFLQRHGVSKNKIKCLYANYIDFDSWKPCKVKKKYDLIFCGRLAENKGLFLLLKALKIAKKQFPHILLAIKGNGKLRRKLDRFIKVNGLLNNVTFIDKTLTLPELVKEINKARVLICTSFNEGGPRVTLEAMACGIPVITTKVGIMNEVIKHNQNGLFIDWSSSDIAEKIVLLLKNDSLRKKIRINSIKAVQGFDYTKLIKNYALGCQGAVK
jgi:glycosyltransferase involved in cell wall biosynthesis